MEKKGLVKDRFIFPHVRVYVLRIIVSQ